MTRTGQARKSLWIETHASDKASRLPLVRLVRACGSKLEYIVQTRDKSGSGSYEPVDRNLFPDKNRKPDEMVRLV